MVFVKYADFLHCNHVVPGDPCVLSTAELQRSAGLFHVCGSQRIFFYFLNPDMKVRAEPETRSHISQWWGFLMTVQCWNHRGLTLISFDCRVADVGEVTLWWVSLALTVPWWFCDVGSDEAKRIFLFSPQECFLDFWKGLFLVFDPVSVCVCVCSSLAQSDSEGSSAHILPSSVTSWGRNGQEKSESVLSNMEQKSFQHLIKFLSKKKKWVLKRRGSNLGLTVLNEAASDCQVDSKSGEPRSRSKSRDETLLQHGFLSRLGSYFWVDRLRDFSSSCLTWTSVF